MTGPRNGRGKSRVETRRPAPGGQVPLRSSPLPLPFRRPLLFSSSRLFPRSLPFPFVPPFFQEVLMAHHGSPSPTGLPAPSAVLDLLDRLRRALEANEQAIRTLGHRWIRSVGVSRFYIAIHRPYPRTRPHRLYPVWMAHARATPKGAPEGIPLGRRLTRAIARARRQEGHWRRYRELFHLFNFWMDRLAAERHLLVGRFLVRVRRLFGLSDRIEKELVATFRVDELLQAQLRALSRGKPPSFPEVLSAAGGRRLPVPRTRTLDSTEDSDEA